jgi:hypothetical protein
MSIKKIDLDQKKDVKLKTVLNTIAYSVLVKGDIIFVGVG